MRVERAGPADVFPIKGIANQYKDELGFVNRTAVRESIEKGFVLVARLRTGEVVGFVEYNEPSRGANKGYSVIYHLAVRKDWCRRGVGRILAYAVPAPIRLKVTTDNPAVQFYEAAGFTRTRTVAGRKRDLYVYEMNVLCIHVQGNNREIPIIAARAGMAYGTRHKEVARRKPFMLDIDWKKYDWADYMAQVRGYQPVMAMAADYEHPCQRRQLYQQIRDLRAAGVLRVMVSPKFAGAVRHIPSWCVVALSVPSAYAGWLPNMDELRGRRVHLLGGTPRSVRDLIPKLRGAGVRVLSYDFNAHERAAQTGNVWKDGQRWRPPDRSALSRDDYYALLEQSAANIRREINNIALADQQPMLPGFVQTQ